jgi:ABC-type transport system involved in cytochrome bd biosynthesis fused ATPase/permease subunit
LLVYRGLEDICQSLVELSRNLFDIDAWQHYRDSGYESGIPIKEHCLPRPLKAGPSVLRDVSLSIPASQHTVIMGPSGTGKTTLLRVLAGILKPNEERVAVLGQPLLSFSMSYWANLRQGRQRC